MKNLNIFSLVTEYENAKSGGVLNVPNVSFVDEDSSVRYLLKNVLTHNGYEYVDLGLSVKWATCNIGASSPEEYGLYFAWGETIGYTTDDVTSRVRTFSNKVYKAGPAASISTDLTLEQDAAHVIMGGNWRMSTTTELQKLAKVSNTWTAENHIYGRKWTSGNYTLFIPAAGSRFSRSFSFRGSYGYIWSSSLNTSDPCFAYLVFFSSSSVGSNYSDRCGGCSVRGVVSLQN